MFKRHCKWSIKTKNDIIWSSDINIDTYDGFSICNDYYYEDYEDVIKRLRYIDGNIILPELP